jgi:hypothetical protein
MSILFDIFLLTFRCQNDFYPSVVVQLTWEAIHFGAALTVTIGKKSFGIAFVYFFNIFKSKYCAMDWNNLASDILVACIRLQN